MYMLFVYAHNMLSSLITLTRSRLLGINNTCRDTYTQLKFCASNALFCCIYMGLAEIYTMCVSACVRVDVNVWGIFFSVNFLWTDGKRFNLLKFCYKRPANMATWAALHLFAQCHYTRRLWTELGASVPTATANMASWDTYKSTAQWWKVASASTELSPKTMRSLLLLICWEIWNERNGRIFRHKESSVLTLLAKIKEEARAWRLAGAKCPRDLWPGE